jgi:hypothetical protein
MIPRGLRVVVDVLQGSATELCGIQQQQGVVAVLTRIATIRYKILRSATKRRMTPMNTKELVKWLQSCGVTVEAEDGKLKLDGTREVVEKVLPCIRERREQLIAYLSRNEDDYMELLRDIYRVAKKINAGQKELMPEYDRLVMILQVHQGVI